MHFTTANMTFSVAYEGDKVSSVSVEQPCGWYDREVRDEILDRLFEGVGEIQQQPVEVNFKTLGTILSWKAVN